MAASVRKDVPGMLRPVGVMWRRSKGRPTEVAVYLLCIPSYICATQRYGVNVWISTVEQQQVLESRGLSSSG
jgi:hypothetical protein